MSNTYLIDLKNFYQSQKFKLLIINKKANYSQIDFDPQYLLLQNNPQINLERLLQIFNPKQIIADGSNSPWLIQKWKNTCMENGINFYDTSAKGALKINL